MYLAKKLKPPKIKIKQAFTLIELLVVIAIIGLLATIITVSLNSSRIKARDAKRKAELKNIQLAMELFYDRYNNYPYTAGWIECSGYNYTYAAGHTGQDLESTIETEGLMTQVPFDPSGNPQNCDGGTDAGGGYRSYMQYMSDCSANGSVARYCLYANLENPSTENSLLKCNFVK